MRLAVTLLLALHGAIHVLGFLKWSKLAEVPQLSGRTLFPTSSAADRTFAVLWLAVALTLVGAAALRLARNDAWWTLALPGLLVSQCLVLVAWPDAKVGSVANMILLLPALVAGANARFVQGVETENRALLARASKVPSTAVEAAELERLPAPVRDWLVASGSVGRNRIAKVRLKQRGELRTAPSASWMPARAEQYFSIDPPGFVWRVDATMFGVLPIVGRDKYVNGHGHMLIKAASLVSIVDAADEKIDQGSLLRFLGEMVWFPSAALSPYLTWQEVDATHARVTMRHAGLSVSAVYAFDARGRVAGMRAERYLGDGAQAKLMPWLVSCTEWGTFDGIEVPIRGDVAWQLPDLTFSYYRWQITDLGFDRADLYPRSHEVDVAAAPVATATSY